MSLQGLIQTDRAMPSPLKGQGRLMGKGNAVLLDSFPCWHTKYSAVV